MHLSWLCEFSHVEALGSVLESIQSLVTTIQTSVRRYNNIARTSASSASPPPLWTKTGSDVSSSTGKMGAKDWAENLYLVSQRPKS